MFSYKHEKKKNEKCKHLQQKWNKIEYHRKILVEINIRNTAPLIVLPFTFNSQFTKVSKGNLHNWLCFHLLLLHCCFFPQHPNRCSIWLSLSDRENTLEALYQANGVSMKNETILSLGKLTNLGWRRKMRRRTWFISYEIRERNQFKKNIYLI